MRLKDTEATFTQNDAKVTALSHQDQDQEVYPVTEGVKSEYTKQIYKDAFNRFLRHIKIYDLKVLKDFGSKVLEQMIIKYVIHVRDVKNPPLSRGSIQA